MSCRLLRILANRLNSRNSAWRGQGDRNIRNDIQMNGDPSYQATQTFRSQKIGRGVSNIPNVDSRRYNSTSDQTAGNQSIGIGGAGIPTVDLSRYPPTYLAPIKTPPVFNGTNYENWKGGISFWEDIHGRIGDAQLVAELALSPHKIYRPIIMRFMKETKEGIKKRPFVELLSRMDADFLMGDGDRSMGKLNKFQNFKRRPNESIRCYWIRFGALVDRPDRHGLVLSPAMKFLKSLHAMVLNDRQRMTLLAGLSNNNQQNGPLALKVLSARLLIGVGKTEETYLHEVDSNENILMLKGGKNGNRPGAEASAIEGTLNQHGMNNKANGKGGRNVALGK